MKKKQIPQSTLMSSPWVTASLLADRSTRISEVQTSNDAIFWLETRSAESGRTVIVCKKGEGKPVDITTSEFNVRSAVHEYGGGAYIVHQQGYVFFSNSADHRIYLAKHPGQIERFGGSDGCRYADFTMCDASRHAHKADPLGVMCVREDHRRHEEEAETSIIWMSQKAEHVVLRGHHFYASPRLSPDGRYLAFISWDHPNMPWDETHLTLATLDWSTGVPKVVSQQILHGDTTPCSVMEPIWKNASTLYAVSDVHAIWQPIFFEQETCWAEKHLPDTGFEIGMPAWVFGQRSISLCPDGSLLAFGHQSGVPRVVRYDGKNWTNVNVGMAADVPIPFAGKNVWIEAPSDGPPVLRYGFDLPHSSIIRKSFALPDGVTSLDCSSPRPLTFKTRDGAEAYGFFYTPVGNEKIGNPDALPPLVVMAHGGPTAAASPSFSFKIQWWVTRGFSVLDVNYRGSSGWGRAYRQSLYGEWGVRDVEDCIDAAEYVCAQGWSDHARCVIRGSSSGGLTVLEALSKSKSFCAGTVLYGVTDLVTLAAETHKFESHYLDRLIGALPDCASLYRARSPSQHAERISAPVLFFHGDADRVVPLGQAQEMHQRLIGQGVRSELVTYPGEGHGFRTPEVVQDVYEREYAFYLDVFQRADV